MIAATIIQDAIYSAMRLAATRLPPDVRRALLEALARETEPLAKAHLESCLRNAELAEQGRGLVCGDTGFPLYFVRVGAGVDIEGGIASIEAAARAATVRATDDGFLRPTMVDALARSNPGDNTGPGMPRVEVTHLAHGNDIRILAAPKGGGSEIFGTFYRMLYPSDGTAGIMKFVLDCVRESCYAGKICPPAIVGVGIGGTADLCMKLAKEAALLRAVGSVSPDPLLAELERTLLAATRDLGIGPMGSRGTTCVLGMHLAKAATHTAALPVAFNAQCLVGRRWTVCIDSDGSACYSGELGAWSGTP